jgi:hypothetical protein
VVILWVSGINGYRRGVQKRKKLVKSRLCKDCMEVYGPLSSIQIVVWHHTVECMEECMALVVWRSVWSSCSHSNSIQLSQMYGGSVWALHTRV